MSDRTRGGLYLPDAETLADVHNELPATKHASLPPDIRGKRFLARPSSRFFLDPKTGLFDFEEVFVLVMRAPLDAPEPLIPILEAIARECRPVLIATPRVTGLALAMLVVNRLRGVLLHACAIDASAEVLDALALSSGCTGAATLDELGNLQRVVVCDDEIALAAPHVESSVGVALACPRCGAAVRAPPAGARWTVCEFCGTTIGA